MGSFNKLSHRLIQLPIRLRLFAISSVAAIATTAASLLPAIAQDAQGICPAALPEAIATLTDQPQFSRTRWGILVETVDQSATLYAREAEHFFIPASNAKLLTTAAALTALGAEYQVQTTVVQLNPAESTAATPEPLRIALVGQGDPALGDGALRSLAEQLRDRGITEIAELWVDDHFFGGEQVNPNWEWEDVQAGYGAPVNSLMVNGNAIAFRLIPQALGQPLRLEWDDPAQTTQWQIDNRSRTVAATEPEFTAVGRDLSRPILYLSGQLRVGAEPDDGAIAIPDPTTNALQRFQHQLQAVGITVDQRQIAPAPTPANAPVLAVQPSDPLADWVRVANQDSDNLYAEALLRHLGVASVPMSSASSLQSGIDAVETTLQAIGVDSTGFALVDGSGIARQNLASPAVLVQTLQAMARSPHAQVYLESLAIAGSSGTLRNRFQGTAAEGRLYGKTGALSGAAALSGYLFPPNHQPLAFSILVNHFDQPVRTVRPVMDAIVLQLMELRSDCGADYVGLQSN